MEFNLYTITKKNIFSLTHDIYHGEELTYKAKIHFFLKGCRFSTIDNEEIFHVKRKFTPFKQRYQIEHGGNVFAHVNVKGRLKTNLIVTSDEGDYMVRGKAFQRDFTVIKDNEEIAKVSRKGVINRKIGIAIREGEDDEFILALVMLIEIIIRSKRAKNG